MINIPLTEIHTEGRIQTSPASAEEPHLQIRSFVHSASETWKDLNYPEFEKHPIEEQVKAQTDQSLLRTVPIRLVFDKPEHNLKARYEAWSNGLEDMPVCIGNGKRANVLNPATGERTSHICKGPSLCKMALLNDLKCGLVAKMPVKVNENVFEFRTSSVNTYTAIMSELQKITATEGGLRHVPLELGVWQKSTRSSDFKAFSCASIKMVRGAEPSQRELPLHANDSLEQLGAELLARWESALDVSEEDGKQEPELKLNMPANRARISAGEDQFDSARSIEALFEPFVQGAQMANTTTLTE